MKIIIATIKPWNIERAEIFKNLNKGIYDIITYTDKAELTYENIIKFNPDFIFFPHWSYIIPEEISKQWTCIVFHMTDLPYGRGGSPLQNLIIRGHKETKISAIKVTNQIDGGSVYIKRQLFLNGSAKEIFIRCSDIIFNDMIPYILNNNPKPTPQTGEIVEFKRRKPTDSEIAPDFELDKIYDYIRMLDADDYPNAYINYGNYKISFCRAEYDINSETIEANVKIKKR